MSRKHPIIAVTGSSGAGRGSVRETFEQMFRREGLRGVFVDGESYHKYPRAEMKVAVTETALEGTPQLSHFGPEANLFNELEELYKTYANTGTGKRRFYLHTEKDAAEFGNPGLKSGEFTPWEDIPRGADCLLYGGLHGWVRTNDVDLRPYPDLKIGVVPVINLEWIQKIDRDTRMRGYSEEAVMETILRRMPDYVRCIIPQFQYSDINFQRVATVDTSNPVIARDVPSDDESVVVVRFRDPDQFGIDFPNLLREVQGSWMSRRNTIVVPGGKMGLAMQLILCPILCDLVAGRRKAVTG